MIVTDETLGEAQGHEAAHAAAKLLDEAQQAEVRAFMGIFEKFNENVVSGRQSAYHENVVERLAPSLPRAISKTPDCMLGGGGHSVEPSVSPGASQTGCVSPSFGCCAHCRRCFNMLKYAHRGHACRSEQFSSV